MTQERRPLDLRLQRHYKHGGMVGIGSSVQLQSLWFRMPEVMLVKCISRKSQMMSTLLVQGPHVRNY